MEKLTKDEMEFLGQFEHNFSCAIDSDYVRGVALSDLEKMRTIWERISGIKDFYLNSSCGSCVLTFFKQIGGEYRKQKAEPTLAPKSAPKKSPKKK